MAEAQKRLVREYETIYLIKAETPDEQVEEIKERLRGVVNREGGKVIRFTNQGKRKTAFPVAKNPGRSTCTASTSASRAWWPSSSAISR